MALALQFGQAQSYQTYGKEFWFGFLENIDISKRMVTLFTETENATDVFIDGEDVSSDFVLFPNNEMYSYAMIELDTGVMELDATNGVLAYAYGFGDFDAYTYHLSYASPDVSSTNDLSLESDLLVWPTPFTEVLNLENNNRQKISNVQLLDVNGRVVQKGIDLNAGESVRWELENLPAGIYFLSYEMLEQPFLMKVVGL